MEQVKWIASQADEIDNFENCASAATFCASNNDNDDDVEIARMASRDMNSKQAKQERIISHHHHYQLEKPRCLIALFETMSPAAAAACSSSSASSYAFKASSVLRFLCKCIKQQLLPKATFAAIRSLITAIAIVHFCIFL